MAEATLTGVRKATIKQRRALAIMAENGGNVSAAMRAAGYSAQTAKTPTKLTESQAFISLMDEMGITDTLMLSTLKDGLQATRESEPDHVSRHKYLETAIRIKGYAKGDIPGNTINFNFGAKAYLKSE